MRHKTLFICLILLLLGVFGFSSAIAQQDNLVNQAVILYEEGKLTEAEHLALRILTRTDTLSKIDQFNLHKLLAFIAIANDDEEGGIRQFVSAMRNNPAVSPDPITWSPKVRRVFDKARLEFAKEQEQQQRRTLVMEATLGRDASLRSLYFPGSGQYLKNQTTKGTIIGIAFWGSVAFGGYSAVKLSNAKDDYMNATTSADAARLWKDYRNANYMFNISGIIVGGIYLYSYFDALWGTSQVKNN